MMPPQKDPTETAILAGGCFWGMEDLIRQLPGVRSTIVGYCGGNLENPAYSDVKQGKTGHAEAIRVDFDPLILSYEALLDFFFRIHDPSQLDRQMGDIGTQYRSVIFTTSESQRSNAKKKKAEVERSGRWPSPLVTQIVDAPTFWPAEDEHQNYLQKNPGGYTCHWIRP